MRRRRKSANIRSRRLTSRAAARFLGVSEASVKRWADSGLLPVERTAGGHRRFRPEDVSLMRNEKLARQPHAQVAGGKAAPLKTPAIRLSSEREKELVNETFQILTEGRAEELSSLLANLNLNGLSLGAIADRFLCPALRRVGDLWYRGELSIAVEHLAARTALQVIERLRAVNGSPKNPDSLALCCSTEGDFHELPVHLTATVLEEKGFEVIVLGASMPFFALGEAVEKFQPRLICVAATIELVNLERTVREYAQFHALARRTGSAVVLGGAGFEGEIRKRLPADLYAKNFQQLVEFVEPIIQEVNDDKNT